MSVYDSAGRPTVTAAVLSPQQFHNRVEVALRTAMAARSNDQGEGGDEGTQMLSGLLEEVPALVPREPYPPFVLPMLIDGVRQMIDGRRSEAGSGSERLLADLLQFVLAFYPEAVMPPPLQGEPFAPGR